MAKRRRLLYQNEAKYPLPIPGSAFTPQPFSQSPEPRTKSQPAWLRSQTFSTPVVLSGTVGELAFSSSALPIPRRLPPHLRGVQEAAVSWMPRGGAILLELGVGPTILCDLNVRPTIVGDVRTVPP